MGMQLTQMSYITMPHHRESIGKLETAWVYTTLYWENHKYEREELRHYICEVLPLVWISL